MGNSLTEANSITLTETFEERCPFYMSIGMTYEDFWFKDVCMTKFYLKAYELKLEQKDTEIWLQGVYIYEALIKVAPILHAFAKSGAKAQPYAEKPYGIFSRKKQKQATKQEIEDEAKKKLEIEKTQWFFKNWVASFKK